ncbi:MAG: glycosyltransferase family 4 protein [Lapillicoccus sp.]
MRVLHVISSDRFAGVERHVALLAAAQHDAGKDVVVVGGAAGPMVAAIERPGVRHLAAPTLVRATQQARAFAPRADVVHVHMTASEVAGVVGAMGTSAAVVTTRHFAERRGSTPPARLVGRWAARRMAGQIAVSHYAADALEGDSVVVHAGVRNGPDESGVLGRGRTVLLAQRLEREKRADLALQVFAASGLASAGWILEVAGTGGEHDQLVRLAARLRISEQTRFVGQQGDVAGLMARAGIFLAPRPDEAYGLSVLEAMAAGLPVVAAGGGGHLETVGRLEHAALYPPGNLSAAADLLSDLAEDVERRGSLATGQQLLQRSSFTLETQESATDAVYRRLLR